jgi:manganese/zinc/iron transport system substrate-binding protein
MLFLRAYGHLAILVVTLLGGCGPAVRRQDDGKLHVVATTSMIADLARQIGGDFVTVTGLMGPGVDPHLYQASEGDVVRMSSGEVVLYNGLHLEGKMADIFHQMKERGISTVGLAEEAIPDSLLRESATFAGNYDPHVWFDVTLWKRVAERLALVFAEMDSVHAEEYRRRLAEYSQRLDSLDGYIRMKAAELLEERRVIITSHDAFGYFGRTYGFEVKGLQGISTATEAGTADVQALADFVAERRIPALFVESSVSARGIEAVREAVRSRGFEVSIGGTLFGDALGNPGTPEGEYLGMMRYNIDTIASSLSEEGRSLAERSTGRKTEAAL